MNNQVKSESLPVNMLTTDVAAELALAFSWIMISSEVGETICRNKKIAASTYNKNKVIIRD